MLRKQIIGPAVGVCFLMGSPSFSSHAKVIAEPGEIQPDMRRQLPPDMEEIFAGVGRIECEDSWGNFKSTATLVGDGGVILGSAHFNLVHDERGQIVHRFSPTRCDFAIGDILGQEDLFRTSIDPRRIFRVDAETRIHENPENDVALIRINRTATYRDGTSIPTLRLLIAN